MPPASQLEDPAILQAFAEAYAGGMSRVDMLRTFQISDPTYRKWVKDPRVQQIASKEIQERVNRMLRVIDKELESRLGSRHLSNMDTEVLLKMRKEIMDKVTKVEVSSEVTHTVDPVALWAAFDTNPDALDKAGQALLVENVATPDDEDDDDD